MCDTSDYVMGTVLAQRKDNKPHAMCYASRTLDKTQLNYATMDNEFLAIVFALEKFRSYVVNSKVIVFTDDVALKHLMKKSDSKTQLIH